jgi:hypothetical protein
MAETRTTFPPDELTDDERNALAGRYQEDVEPCTDPPGHGIHGREQAAPRGTVYVRDQEAERAVSIRVAIAQFRAVGEEVPEHLQSLFDGLPDELKADPEPEPEAEEAESEGEEEESGEPEAEAEEEADLELFTVAELRAKLESLGVEIPPGSRKADLVALLEQAEAE